MTLGTYHAHTEFCDGKSTMEEMILSAIAKGASEIGFTPHSPIPGEVWCMSAEGLEKYLAAVGNLKQKYADRIRVFCGVEYDIKSRINRENFDYILGSSHSVTVNGKNIWVDASASELRENVNKYFHSDVYLLAEAYYEELSCVYEKTKCDIIGHFDLLTKFNEVYPLFDIENPRYIKARDKALTKLLDTPAIFEVNMGAVASGYRNSPYPDDNVLKRIAEAGKSVVVNSDSHHADTVLFGIEKEKERLRLLGINCVESLSEILQLTRN